MESKSKPSIWQLYRQMLRSRLFEQAVMQFWEEGKISGEMHMGIGEEAIVAGILDHVQEGDSMALDHRGTPPLVMRGVDLVSLMQEFLGYPEGLCRGNGGHMHLFSKEYLAASSGILGSSGPIACGFALSSQYLRPGSIAVSFFGDGTMNQGMLLESFNLAVVWKLPVFFVCKDSEWAITTVSSTVTGGKLIDRAKGFGMNAIEIDGTDVEKVWQTAGEAINRARKGEGPTFLHTHCCHLEGHFLGDPLVQVARKPIGEMKKMAGSIIKSITKFKGSSIRKRTESLGAMTSLINKTAKEQTKKEKDPIEVTRKKLQSEEEKLQELENEVKNEITQVVEKISNL